MKERIKKSLIELLLFLMLTIMTFLGHYFYNTYADSDLSYKVHFLIWFLSFIVVTSSLLLYVLDVKDKIGYLYLGFVVFKMFGMGYMAVFEPSFKEYVIYYFIIFWCYLSAEALLVIRCLQKQDKNHNKHIQE